MNRMQVMKWTISVIALSVAFALSVSVSAGVALAGGGDLALGTCCDPCGDACYDPCCGSGTGGVVADAEVMFLRYFQEGGVTDAGGQAAEFDYKIAPRFEVGYVAPGGLGIRSRYWMYEHSTRSLDADLVALDTYYVDVECFEEYCLTRYTTVEVFLGVRYAEFGQASTDLQTNSLFLGRVDGFGATLGAEANRALRVGNLYARGRFSVLMCDADMWDVDLRTGAVAALSADDHTATQTELALGYEVSRSLGSWGLATARIGGEWQNWANVAIADTAFGGVGNDDVFEDAGFAGFVVGLGLER
jgi:hypothetical protein